MFKPLSLMTALLLVFSVASQAADAASGDPIHQPLRTENGATAERLSDSEKAKLSEIQQKAERDSKNNQDEIAEQMQLQREQQAAERAAARAAREQIDPYQVGEPEQEREAAETLKESLYQSRPEKND